MGRELLREPSLRPLVLREGCIVLPPPTAPSELGWWASGRASPLAGAQGWPKVWTVLQGLRASRCGCRAGFPPRATVLSLLPPDSLGLA